METNKISLQRLAHFFLLLFLVGYLLIIGQTILAPLAFGALFAFMLKPVADFYEKYIKWQIPAIVLTMLSATIPVLIIIMLFSSQLVDVFEDMPSIEKKLNAGLNSLEGWVRQTFGLTRREADELISEQTSKLVDAPISFLSGGLVSSTTFLTGFFLTGIYVFLFLLYRSAFKHFFLMQSNWNHRGKVRDILKRVQAVVQQYLYGLLIVMLILGTLNSLGLWVIGIKHALFWGFLAAFLAIIPYIGTFIGGLLPFLYALATADYSWQPLAVIILFSIIQFIEGNLITPNVVGSSVKINPLAAILALLVGNAFWGIAGMVLALPAVAVIKELMKQIDFLRPVSLLMSDELTEREELFSGKLDEDRFRFWNFFKRDEK